MPCEQQHIIGKTDNSLAYKKQFSFSSLLLNDVLTENTCVYVAAEKWKLIFSCQHCVSFLSPLGDNHPVGLKF
jgi:hypothetical protein